MTQAAAGHPNVKALVSIAAHIPETGEKLGDLAAMSHDSKVQRRCAPPRSATRTAPAGSNSLWSRPGSAGSSPPTCRSTRRDSWRRSSVRSAPRRSRDAPTAAAWHTIPTWSLVARQDKPIGTHLERFEVRQAHTHTAESDGSHVVMISHPDIVERPIESTARATDH
ncbi:alpha/beta fold hydrolase [Streptomyces sp. NPDC002520]